MQPPPSNPDTVLAAILTAAIGSVAVIYQDAVIVAVAAAFGGFLSLQRSPAHLPWYRALLHVVQCFGLAVLLVDVAASALWVHIPASWGLSRHALMASVAGAIAWSWPESGRLAINALGKIPWLGSEK